MTERDWVQSATTEPPRQSHSAANGAAPRLPAKLGCHLAFIRNDSLGGPPVLIPYARRKDEMWIF